MARRNLFIGYVLLALVVGYLSDGNWRILAAFWGGAISQFILIVLLEHVDYIERQKEREEWPY